MKRILVCGATGFMGRNIVEHFKKQTPYVFTPSRGEYDLTIPYQVKQLIKQYKPHILIQAAATTSGSKDIINKPYLHVTDNAVMNSLLLREAYEGKVNHFIFLSCGVMYQPGSMPRREDDYSESHDNTKHTDFDG